MFKMKKWLEMVLFFISLVCFQSEYAMKSDNFPGVSYWFETIKNRNLPAREPKVSPKYTLKPILFWFGKIGSKAQTYNALHRLRPNNVKAKLNKKSRINQKNQTQSSGEGLFTSIKTWLYGSALLPRTNATLKTSAQTINELSVKKSDQVLNAETKEKFEQQQTSLTSQHNGDPGQLKKSEMDYDTIKALLEKGAFACNNDVEINDINILILLIQYGYKLYDQNNSDKMISPQGCQVVCGDSVDWIYKKTDRYLGHALRNTLENAKKSARDKRIVVWGINYRDIQGRTPLILASQKTHCWKAKMLLNLGAAVNAQDAKGKTALWYAFKNRCDQTIQVLVEHGADLNQKYKDGKTYFETIKDLDSTDPCYSGVYRGLEESARLDKNELLKKLKDVDGGLMDSSIFI